MLEHSCFTNSEFKPVVSCKSKLGKIGGNLTFQKLLYKAVIPIKQHLCVHVSVCTHRHGTDNYWRRKNGEKLGKNMKTLLLQSTWSNKIATSYTCSSESIRMSVQLQHFNLNTFHNYLHWQQLKVPIC